MNDASPVAAIMGMMYLVLLGGAMVTWLFILF
jgi:hypothetical protein